MEEEGCKWGGRRVQVGRKKDARREQAGCKKGTRTEQTGCKKEQDGSKQRARMEQVPHTQATATYCANNTPTLKPMLCSELVV